MIPLRIGYTKPQTFANKLRKRIRKRIYQIEEKCCDLKCSKMELCFLYQMAMEKLTLFESVKQRYLPQF